MRLSSHEDVKRQLSSQGGMLMASLESGSAKDAARRILGLAPLTGAAGAAAATAAAAAAPAPGVRRLSKLDSFRRRQEEEQRKRRASDRVLAVAAAAVAGQAAATTTAEGTDESVQPPAGMAAATAVCAAARRECAAGKSIPSAPPAPPGAVIVSAQTVADVCGAADVSAVAAGSVAAHDGACLEPANSSMHGTGSRSGRAQNRKEGVLNGSVWASDH